MQAIEQGDIGGETMDELWGCPIVLDGIHERKGRRVEGRWKIGKMSRR